MLATSALPFSETRLFGTVRAWSHQSMSDANESGPSACHASAFQHVVCKCRKETMRDRLLMSSHRASFPALLALLAD